MLLALVATLASCVKDEPYACLRDSECTRGGVTGVCETTGFCSFADASCGARERRYGDLAPSELAGTCVPCVAQLAAGARHTCARMQDGELACWGDNSVGQVGNGEISDVTVPATVASESSGAPLGRASSLSAGTEHTCAVLDDHVYCWGDNDVGELGNPDLTMPQRRPRAVVDAVGGMVRGRTIAAGLSHSCAVDDSRSLSCWGDNRASQLGVSMSVLTSTTAPRFVIDGVTSPIVGGDAYHSCALREDASLWCWGGNDDGQVGNGAFVNVTMPVPVLPGERVVAASIGNETSCSVLESGELHCWGSNTDGQLGDGSTVNRPTPAAVPGLTGVRSVAVGGRHVCATLQDHSLWCWGRGTEGQLGPDTTGSTQPVQIRAGTVSVTAGSAHTCVVEVDGHIRCFGANESGQLGIGNKVTTPEPTLVSLTCE